MKMWACEEIKDEKAEVKLKDISHLLLEEKDTSLKIINLYHKC